MQYKGSILLTYKQRKRKWDLADRDAIYQLQQNFFFEK